MNDFAVLFADGRSVMSPVTREMHVGALFLATQHLGPGELSVLVTIAQRLEMGRQQYGDLDPVRDPRNWRKEPRRSSLTQPCMRRARCFALKHWGAP